MDSAVVFVYDMTGHPRHFQWRKPSSKMKPKEYVGNEIKLIRTTCTYSLLAKGSPKPAQSTLIFNQNLIFLSEVGPHTMFGKLSGTHWEHSVFLSRFVLVKTPTSFYTQCKIFKYESFSLGIESARKNDIWNISSLSGSNNLNCKCFPRRRSARGVFYCPLKTVGFCSSIMWCSKKWGYTHSFNNIVPLWYVHFP